MLLKRGGSRFLVYHLDLRIQEYMTSFVRFESELQREDLSKTNRDQAFNAILLSDSANGALLMLKLWHHRQLEERMRSTIEQRKRWMESFNNVIREAEAQASV